MVLRALVIALALTGCSTVAVGVPCESRADCASSLDCVTSPGGFCTRGCAEAGATTECPEGTVCVYFGDSRLQCAPYCTTTDDCRINYECVLAGTITGAKACRPENAK
jgi:hypothetical protein